MVVKFYFMCTLNSEKQIVSQKTLLLFGQLKVTLQDFIHSLQS